MGDLLEAIVAMALGLAGMMLLLVLTVLPWALGLAWMLGWLA